jgi:crossover junction endodeoxyribonuclease RuvC
MRILGIDPGTATTGFGVVDYVGGKIKFIDAGVILTEAKEAMPERLVTIAAELKEIIDEYQPDHAAVELLYFSTNVTTAISVGQARGVVLLTLAQAGISISEYTPLQVKQGVTGYGKADKKQIQEMVKTLLGLKSVPKPDDAADALALAICASQKPLTA